MTNWPAPHFDWIPAASTMPHLLRHLGVTLGHQHPNGRPVTFNFPVAQVQGNGGQAHHFPPLHPLPHRLLGHKRVSGKEDIFIYLFLYGKGGSTRVKSKGNY